VVVVFTTPFMAMFDRVSSGMVVKSGYLFSAGSWLVPYLLVMAGNTSSAYCFLRDGVRRLQARLSPQGTQAVAEQLEFVEKEGPASRPDFAARFEERLQQLDREIRAGGASPIYVYLPSSTDIRAGELIAQAGLAPARYDLRLHIERLRRHAQASGIPLIDLEPTIQALYAKGERLSFAQDPHYDARTNHAIGEALAAPLLAAARASPPPGR
jgi:hypothetical protein